MLQPAACISCCLRLLSLLLCVAVAAGDPTDVVLAALVAAERAFGADVNAKGFKVPRGVGVIQVR